MIVRLHIVSPLRGRRPGGDGPAGQGPAVRRAGFTLVEIMVAIGIMAIILAVGIPAFARMMHKDSMRQAVADVQEACTQARSRAVLQGVVTELKIRPAEKTITVTAGSAPANTSGSLAMETVEAGEHRGGGGTVYSMKFSDHIFIEFIGVNLIADLQLDEEASAFFYPNGTADELVILLRSDSGEIRKISTDVITGISDMEVVR